MTSTIAILHLFLFQNASFFILLAYILTDMHYILLYLVGDAVQLGCLLHDQLHLLLPLKHLLNAFRHLLLQTLQLLHQYLFLILTLATVEVILSLRRSTIFVL